MNMEENFKKAKGSVVGERVFEWRTNPNYIEAQLLKMTSGHLVIQYKKNEWKNMIDVGFLRIFLYLPNIIDNYAWTTS